MLKEAIRPATEIATSIIQSHVGQELDYSDRLKVEAPMDMNIDLARMTGAIEYLSVAASHARRIPSPYWQGHGLKDVSEAYVEMGDVLSAIEIAKTIPSRYVRVKALAELSLLEGHGHLVHQAFDQATRIQREDWRRDAIGLVAVTQVKVGLVPEAIRTARLMIAEKEMDYDLSTTLAALTSLTNSETTRSFVKETLSKIHDEEMKIRVLIALGVAEQSPDYMWQAVQTAYSIPNKYRSANYFLDVGKSVLAARKLGIWK